jgi:hypothetical protein
LWRIRWVAPLELVSAMKPRSSSASSKLQPNTVGRPGLPLRIGRAPGSLRLTSRSAITRSPASRWSVWASSRSVAVIVSWSAPTSRPSRPSMGTIGDALDNAVIESFWARMETELLDRRR